MVSIFRSLILVSFGLQLRIILCNELSNNSKSLVREIVMKTEIDEILVFVYEHEVIEYYGRGIWKEINTKKHLLVSLDTISQEDLVTYFKNISMANVGRYLVFVTMLSQSRTIDVLKIVNEIDQNSRKTINIRHWSKWIIFCEYNNIDVSRFLPIVSYYDNLMIVYINSLLHCKVAATLLMSETGPVFSPVNISSSYDPELAFPNMDKGYNSRHLKVLTKVWPSFIDQVYANGSVTYTGYLVQLMDNIAKTLNFTYTFYNDEESDWVGFVNGTPTGLFYRIQNGEYDLLCAPSAVTHDRLEMLDYILPMHFTDLVMPTYRQQPSDSLKLIYTKPFQPSVFVLILSMSLVFCLLLWLHEKYHPFRQSSSNKPLLPMIFEVFGILLNQGGSLRIHSVSGRVFLAFFWFFAVIMAAVYRGNLVAFFTNNEQPTLFKDIRDIIASDFKIGVINPSVYTMSLKTSSNLLSQKFYSKIEYFSVADPDTSSSNNTVHLSRVLQGNYVYIADYSSVSFIYVNNCDIILMDDVFYFQYGLAVAKGSPFRHDLERVMRALSASGILDVWIQQFWPKRRKGLCDTPIVAREIELSDVFALVIAIACCLIFCFLVLIIELFYKARSRK